MNWTNIFSVYALKGILPDHFLHNWRLFVLASARLCNRVITNEDLVLIDQYVVAFCKGVETNYGKLTVTPNMHLTCHLTECIRDYGPIHCFWLFSFERYNGHLGSLPNNNRSVEMQFMRRFNRDSVVRDIKLPVDVLGQFPSIQQMVSETEIR